jgi:hypothetical protein
MNKLKNNKVINFKNLLQSIIFFIIIIIIIFLIFLIINYYYGKSFHKCLKCKPNEVYFIDIKLPEYKIIKNLERQIRESGSSLDPILNFNNAQGKKLNYNKLPNDIKIFYENDNLCKSVSIVVGEKVHYADFSEKYRIFARLYENKDDFLDWHYDNNFTVGNRYTLVIPIIVDKGNTSEFMIKDRKTGMEKIIPIPLGKGVIYNGSVTYHKISQQTDGQKRMVIIIPFYTNYKKTFIGDIREYIRNITYKNLTL